MKRHQIVFTFVFALLASLIQPGLAGAADCVSANYPPGCTDVGIVTPAPTVIDLTALDAIGDVATTTFLFLGTSSPVVATSSTSPDAGTTSLTIPASMTGGVPLKLSLSSSTNSSGGGVQAPANGVMAISTDGFSPGSTLGLYLHSTTVLLTSVKIKSGVSQSAVFSIPANTPAGEHFIEFSGYIGKGTKISLLLPIKVVPSSPSNAKRKFLHLPFAASKSALSAPNRKAIVKYLGSMPKKAKNIRITMQSNYVAGPKVASQRIATTFTYLKSKVKGAAFGTRKIARVSKVSAFKDMVVISATWK